jgi:CHASE2 domain-containing sensor protein
LTNRQYYKNYFMSKKDNISRGTSAKKGLYIESIWATILVIILMLVLFLLFGFSIKPFNYLSKSLKNIQISDIYFQSIKEETIDTNICIINVENLSRKDLAELISMIAVNQPAVIGIDLIFSIHRKEEGDSILQEVLLQNKSRVVLAGFYDAINESYSKDYILFNDIEKGHTNLNAGERRTKVIRDFIPQIVNQKEDQFLAFSAAIARLYDTKNYEKLILRNKESEIINYIGNEHSFKVYNGSDVLQYSYNLSNLKDKIVLLGFMGSQRSATQLDNLNDLFYTPLNPNLWGKSLPDMYGVAVHANIIHMIIAGDYINSWSGLSYYIFLFIVLYLHVLPFIYYFVEKHLWYHVFAKIFQFFSLVILILLSIHLLSVNVYMPELKYLLLCIFVSVDTLYLYEAIAVIVFKRRGLKSIFIHA